MKQTLRFTPFVLALLAQAAAAQSSTVVVAGRMDMAVQSINNGTDTTKRADSGTYTASRLILRGTEDLGGGLGALFYLEHRLTADNGAAASAAKFWNAGSYVGLSSKEYGTVTLGRQYSPIFWPFLFGDDTGPLRLHTYSAVQTIQRSNFVRVAATASPLKAAGTLDSIATGLYTLGISSAFEDNLIVYKSANLNGLTLSASVGAPEGYPAGNAKLFGGNAEYRSGNLYIGAAFNSKEGRIPVGGANSQKLTEQVITGMYTLDGGISLWGNVHPWKFDSNGAKLSGHDYMLGASFKSGQHWLWANYANKSIGNGCTACDAKGFGIGYHYLLSKRSELYTSLAQVKNSANSANTLNGFAPAAAGKNLRGIAAGLAVTF
jgi:general bacterial porin, GBP family